MTIPRNWREHPAVEGSCWAIVKKVLVDRERRGLPPLPQRDLVLISGVSRQRVSQIVEKHGIVLPKVPRKPKVHPVCGVCNLPIEEQETKFPKVGTHNRYHPDCSVVTLACTTCGGDLLMRYTEWASKINNPRYRDNPQFYHGMDVKECKELPCSYCGTSFLPTYSERCAFRKGRQRAVFCFECKANVPLNKRKKRVQEIQAA